MINKTQLVAAEKEHWQALDDKVYQWAKVNVPTQVNYNSRMTYWGSALSAGIITQDEYQLGKTQYGNLWDYVGD